VREDFREGVWPALDLEPICLRCEQGIQEHSCWRRAVQLGAEIRPGMDLPVLQKSVPLRAQLKHGDTMPIRYGRGHEL